MNDTNATAPPPAEDRLTALDLIRGVAVLGVLLANLPHFCGPETPRHKLEPNDRYVAALTQLVVDNKFISMLAMLFGAGLAVQFFKARAAGRPFAAPYLWRQFLLYLIGLSHVVLLWFGDILAVYAAVSVVVTAAVLLGPAWEKGYLVLGLGWCYFLIAVSLAAMLLFGPKIQEFFDKQEKKPALPPGDAPVSLVSGEQPLEKRVEGYFSAENATRIYRHGTFLDQAGHRLMLHGFSFVIGLPFVLFAYLGSCFLIGVQLVRLGAFEPHTRPGWVFSDFLTLGLCVGLPLQVTAVAWSLLAPKAPWPGFLHVLGVLPMALLYLSLLTLWNESPYLPWLQARFRAVGRMALTNYLVQSLISVWVFNNWGLGYYGHTGLLGGMVVVIGVWVLELLWSPIWLHYFRLGPVEWVWRSVAALRPVPVFARREVTA
ncbi:MAG: DUF418 domain-containing protein [Gemmataceae bacterium]